MVRAWYMDDSDEDQRLEHHKSPPHFVSLEDLFCGTGVEYFKLSAETYEEDEKLAAIRAERGYNYMDLVEISEGKLPNYHEKLKNFFIEHIHKDEEVRFVVKGSGFFDVRDEADKWIRIEIVDGDLLIMPAGIYHRFTLDVKNYIKVLRLFAGVPVWTPYNRPADELEERKKYVMLQSLGFKRRCHSMTSELSK